MTTPNTGIPEVPEGTLDPAAGLNLSLNHIDALLQATVIEVGLNTPPGSPQDGDTYIVGTGTGAWAGEDNNLARYVSEGTFWQFFEAGTEVRIAFNLDDFGIYVFDPSSSGGWVPYPVLSSLEDAADDTAAASAGVPVGGLYRDGSVLMIRVA